MRSNPDCPFCNAVKNAQDGDLSGIKQIIAGTPLADLIGPNTQIIAVPIPGHMSAIFEQLKAAMDNTCNCEHCVAARKQALAAGSQAVKLEARENCMPQVDELMGAGWLFVLPEGTPDPEPWQWRWRRPSRVKGKKGRLFASTGQAYNALMRERSGL